MRDGIAVGAVTVWHETADETWSRVIYAGVHVERTTARAVGTRGDTLTDTLRCWLFRSCGVRVGDFAAEGARDDAEPPEDAQRVVSVARYDGARPAAHWEVTAQ